VLRCPVSCVCCGGLPCNAVCGCSVVPFPSARPTCPNPYKPHTTHTRAPVAHTLPSHAFNLTGYYRGAKGCIALQKWSDASEFASHGLQVACACVSERVTEGVVSLWACVCLCGLNVVCLRVFFSIGSFFGAHMLPRTLLRLNAHNKPALSSTLTQHAHTYHSRATFANNARIDSPFHNTHRWTAPTEH